MVLDVASDDAAEGPAKTKQVLSYLNRLISEGMSPHEKLPTERELAATLKVSRLTVRRALSMLDAEGQVYRVQGSGTFVADGHVTKNLELTSFSEDMKARGMVPGSALVEIKRQAAGPTLGYKLNLPPSATVVLVHRVRTADGAPMCVENAYFNSELLPGDFRLGPDESVYDSISTLGIQAQPHHADQQIQATVLSEEEAAKLGVAPFSPALLVERTVFNIQNEPLEWARTTYRADRYAFEVTIKRRQPPAAAF